MNYRQFKKLNKTLKYLYCYLHYYDGDGLEHKYYKSEIRYETLRAIFMNNRKKFTMYRNRSLKYKLIKEDK